MLGNSSFINHGLSMGLLILIVNYVLGLSDYVGQIWKVFKLAITNRLYVLLNDENA